ncbi:hypothetical protein GW915_03905 [bacterium]|nr:hypothetical protein [bacterium]
MKKYLKSNLTLVAMIVVLGACSTAKVRLMPQQDGYVEVVSRDIERDGAEEAAVKKAEDYCKEMDMRPVYAVDETKYEGEMDEEKRKMIRKGSKAAMMLGGVGFGMRNNTVGSVLGGAGAVGSTMTSDRDYTARLKFRCQ